MSVRQQQNVVYGLTNALTNVPLLPIISNRAPTTGDMAALGTIWDFKTQNIAYILTSIVNNEAIWVNITQSPGDFVQFNVQTNGNAPTAIATFAMPSSFALEISGTLIAASDDFAHSAGGLVEGSFIRHAAGGPAQIGNNAIDIDAQGAAVTVDFAIVGNTVELQVTGPVAEIWNWRAEVSTIILS